MTRILVLPFLLLAGTLIGCAGFQSATLAPGATSAVGFSRTVHGGQQPVAGSTIQLYAVGTTGDGSAATPLLTSTVLTDAGGNFNLPSTLPCSGSTLVYLLATGGDPIPSTPNPNLALMVAIGPCSSITTSTFLNVNELTTVAAVNALFPYMASSTQVGSGSSDASALASAFTLANQLVNSSTGTSPGPGVPSTMSVPTAQIYALGDIIANCVNSGGGTAANPSTLCGQLFALTQPPAGSAPADTIQALIDLANDPTLNTAALFNTIPATAVFVTNTTTVPPDWRVRLTPASSPGYVLQVAPSSLAFPMTAISTPSSAQTVIMSNSGSSSITLSSIAVTGVNAADFAQTNTCGSSLAASTQCQVSIVFTPQVTGSRAAYLAVSSSSPNSPQYVQLSGTGTVAATSNQPQAAVSIPGFASVTQVDLSYVGSSQDITLTNAGGGTLTISSVSLANNNDSFSTTCGSSLAPGASCVTTFNGLLAGANQLTFATNDPLLAPVPVVVGYATPDSSTSDIFLSPTLVGSSSSSNLTMLYQSEYALSISGPNAADFTLNPNCASQGLTATQCTATVIFTPSGTGLRTAELNLGYGLGYVPVAGIGTSSPPGSQVTLTPASLTFRDSVAPQTLTLSNYGNSAVGIQSVAIQSIPGINDFSQTNNCGASLPAQSICTITVASSRRVAGGSQSLLSVTGDFGTLANSISTLADTVFDFGYTLLGSSKTGDGFSVYSHNGGSVTESVSGTNVSDFAGNNCSFAFLGECDGTVTFTPSATGVRTAIGVATSSTNGTATNYLQGTGVTSPVPSAVLGPTGAYLINNGTTTLNIAGLAIGSPFTIYAPYTSCVGANTTVAPLITCAISITGGGTQWGYVSTNITFTDSNSGQSFSLPFYTVADVGPPVSVSSIAFPNTQVNDVSSPVSFTVTPQYGHAVTSSGQGPIQAIKGSCAAGESPCVLSFVFAPTTITSNSYHIEVQDAFFGGVTSVPVTATSTPPIVPGAAGVSPTSLSFPTRPVNSTSIPMTVTLSNSGAGSFAITSNGLSGTNASEFSYTTTCGSSVAASGNCTFSVSFAPTTAGSKSATLTINGDANAGLPITVAITGAAQ